MKMDKKNYLVQNQLNIFDKCSSDLGPKRGH